MLSTKLSLPWRRWTAKVAEAAAAVERCGGSSCGGSLSITNRSVGEKDDEKEAAAWTARGGAATSKPPPKLREMLRHFSSQTCWAMCTAISTKVSSTSRPYLHDGDLLQQHLLSDGPSLGSSTHPLPRHLNPSPPSAPPPIPSLGASTHPIGVFSSQSSASRNDGAEGDRRAERVQVISALPFFWVLILVAFQVFSCYCKPFVVKATPLSFPFLSPNRSIRRHSSPRLPQ